MKFETFITGKYVDLVLLDDKIVENTDWWKWLNHQPNTEFLETGKFPNTLEKQIFYVENVLASKKDILDLKQTDKKIQLGVVEKENLNLVGMATAYGFNYISQYCNVSIITDLQKKNFNRLKVFKECQDLLLDHVFFRLNFRKVYSGAYDKKISEMTKKIWGFEDAGVYKNHAYINGKYYDAYILELFKETWEKKTNFKK
tara:strand:+ start:349 stop:948 length:600 start_codon:yes stop_codon:yes gene_type:complete